jgi:hypothetical protein
VRSKVDISERRACAVIGQPRSTQRRRAVVRDDEAPLTAAIVRLATAYGRYAIVGSALYCAPKAGG